MRSKFQYILGIFFIVSFIYAIITPHEIKTLSPSEFLAQQEKDKIEKDKIEKDKIEKDKQAKIDGDDLLGITCNPKSKKKYSVIGETQMRTLKCGWGKPNKINSTIRFNSKHEQWVYGGNNYLYFENGILVTMQN